uniref:Uncharacterized protein n=1 Tax=Cacopsylla melanoneura TaxID=428564 RepID=A0A8D8ZHQ3_9HEMI
MISRGWTVQVVSTGTGMGWSGASVRGAARGGRVTIVSTTMVIPVRRVRARSGVTASTGIFDRVCRAATTRPRRPAAPSLLPSRRPCSRPGGSRVRPLDWRPTT